VAVSRNGTIPRTAWLIPHGTKWRVRLQGASERGKRAWYVVAVDGVVICVRIVDANRGGLASAAIRS
jgi:hypothetical protein